jgi:hypothetical protein
LLRGGADYGSIFWPGSFCAVVGESESDVETVSSGSVIELFERKVIPALG